MAGVEKRLQRGGCKVRVGDVPIPEWIALVANALERSGELDPWLQLQSRHPIQSSQHRQGGQPLRGWWQLEDQKVAVANAQRFDPLRPVPREVVRRDQPVSALDGGHDGGRNLASVEAADSIAAVVAEDGSAGWGGEEH